MANMVARSICFLELDQMGNLETSKLLLLQVLLVVT
jgi:hypothetical protein